MGQTQQGQKQVATWGLRQQPRLLGDAPGTPRGCTGNCTVPSGWQADQQAFCTYVCVWCHPRRGPRRGGTSRGQAVTVRGPYPQRHPGRPGYPSRDTLDKHRPPLLTAMPMSCHTTCCPPLQSLGALTAEEGGEGQGDRPGSLSPTRYQTVMAHPLTAPKSWGPALPERGSRARDVSQLLPCGHRATANSPPLNEPARLGGYCPQSPPRACFLIKASLNQ